jgi:hypothetical protein
LVDLEPGGFPGLAPLAVLRRLSKRVERAGGAHLGQSPVPGVSEAPDHVAAALEAPDEAGGF